MTSISPNPLRNIFNEELVIGGGDPGEFSTRFNNLSKIESILYKSDCTKCSLHTKRVGSQKPVFGAGSGRIMFIGHRIGMQEANTGMPAIGDQSRYGFRIMMEAIEDVTGLDLSRHYDQAREHILDYSYVTNASRCGGQEDTKVSASHWNKCGPIWLTQEITQVDPEILVFWGTGHANALIKDAPKMGEFKICDVFGKMRMVYVMYHPVIVARSPSFYDAVRSQFGALIKYLGSVGMANVLAQPDNDVVHHVLTDPSELPEALEKLKRYEWLGFDTETKYAGPVLGNQKLSERGAFMWYEKEFELVSAQFCGVESDGSVKETFTLACGFVDRLTGAPRQKLTIADVSQFTHEVLAAPLADGINKRKLCVWNAGFDVPVMQNSGVDLIGAGYGVEAYRNVEIIDGMVLLARLNEHLGRIGQLGLDDASKVYLGEGKVGSFKDYFGDPRDFPYNDITIPEVKERVAAYTGGDPEKTILTTLQIFDHLDKHLEGYDEYLIKDPSSLPVLGFSPYPIVHENVTGSRFYDIAINMDHQMIPIISLMSSIGFKLDTSQFKNIEREVSNIQNKLLKKINQSYPGFNPNAPKDTINDVTGMFKELAIAIDRASVSKSQANKALQFYLNPEDKKSTPKEPFITGEKFIKLNTEEKTEALIKAYEQTFEPVNGTAKSITNNTLVYFYAGGINFKHITGNNISSFGFDYDYYKQFFEYVFLYKQVAKKWSTYFVRFSEEADSRSIVHPKYGQSTTSARWQGNFQNIPRGGGEDEKWMKKVLKAIDTEFPEGDDEIAKMVASKNILDARQYIRLPQASDLNDMFKIMPGFKAEYNAEPFVVNTNDEYVGVLADFAAQEDRMAYALTGDKTKKRLLEDPSRDLHFQNVAFCFGDKEGFDTSTDEGVEEAYQYFKSNASKFDAMYRTPMKTVHYASTFGGGVAKLHSLLYPIFMQNNKAWSMADTIDLVGRYDTLYAAVKAFRVNLIERIDSIPFVEYPIFGTLRNAMIDRARDNKVVQGEYLSVANALNQGTSSYITRLALLRLKHMISLNAQRWNLVEVGGDCFVAPLIQVHDEIGVICPKHLAYEVALCLESAMKIIVGPADGETEAYWDDTIADARGETGWLYLPDDMFIGAVLFDADAEIKITLAKAKVLASGEKNKIATTENLESFDSLHQPHRINKAYNLILGRKDHSDNLVF